MRKLREHLNKIMLVLLAVLLILPLLASCARRVKPSSATAKKTQAPELSTPAPTPKTTNSVKDLLAMLSAAPRGDDMRGAVNKHGLIALEDGKFLLVTHNKAYAETYLLAENGAYERLLSEHTVFGAAGDAAIAFSHNSDIEFSVIDVKTGNETALFVPEFFDDVINNEPRYVSLVNGRIYFTVYERSKENDDFWWDAVYSFALDGSEPIRYNQIDEEATLAAGCTVYENLKYPMVLDDGSVICLKSSKDYIKLQNERLFAEDAVKNVLGEAALEYISDEHLANSGEIFLRNDPVCVPCHISADGKLHDDYDIWTYTNEEDSSAYMLNSWRAIPYQYLLLFGVIEEPELKLYLKTEDNDGTKQFVMVNTAKHTFLEMDGANDYTDSNVRVSYGQVFNAYIDNCMPELTEDGIYYIADWDKQTKTAHAIQKMDLGLSAHETILLAEDDKYARAVSVCNGKLFYSCFEDSADGAERKYYIVDLASGDKIDITGKLD